MHTPSVPLHAERGDWYNKKIGNKLCMNCGACLPESEQNDCVDYYHCADCGHVSTEYTR